MEVAKELNVPTDLASKPGRTPYQCFFRVRNRLDPPKKVVWTNELDQQVLDRLKEYPGNWRLVAASIDDPASTKRQVIERYKKAINPVLRNGAFTRVDVYWRIYRGGVKLLGGIGRTIYLAIGSYLGLCKWHSLF